MHLLAISVGNTRTRFGVFRGESLDHSGVMENADPTSIAAAIAALPLDRADAPAVMASVNEPVGGRLAAEMEGAFRGRFYRFGRDFGVPIEHALADASTVGQDRLLNALGAWTRARQACVVIDAGTAVTVDFVDGAGVFQGGAIAPGLNMMLRALHEHTAALPLLRWAGGWGGENVLSPESSVPSHSGTQPTDQDPGPGTQDSGLLAPPFGKDTPSAMLTGVRSAVVGLAHLLVDRYAEHFGAYPRIIATGGDAQVLFENDPIIEHIVPDLTLMGIHAACERLLAGDEAES